MKLSAMIVSAFMMLAACTETVQKQKIPGATYMGGNNTITEICKDCLLYTSDAADEL